MNQGGRTPLLPLPWTLENDATLSKAVLPKAARSGPGGKPRSLWLRPKSRSAGVKATLKHLTSSVCPVPVQPGSQWKEGNLRNGRPFDEPFGRPSGSQQEELADAKLPLAGLRMTRRSHLCGHAPPAAYWVRCAKRITQGQGHARLRQHSAGHDR